MRQAKRRRNNMKGGSGEEELACSGEHDGDTQEFEGTGRSRAGHGKVVDPGGTRESRGARKALLERLRERNEEQNMKKRRTEEAAGEEAAQGAAGEATYRCKRRWAVDKADDEEAKRGRTAAEEEVEQGRKCYHHPPRGMLAAGADGGAEEVKDKAAVAATNKASEEPAMTGTVEAKKDP